MIRVPLGLFPALARTLIESKLALVRIQRYLYAKNVDIEAIEGSDSQGIPSPYIFF
jgi:hypothetical protein